MEDQEWTPFCRKRRNYEHAVHSKNDLSCPYCGQANPDRIGQNSGRHDSTPMMNPADVIVLNSPPALQTASSRAFPQLERASEMARQHSIAKTKKAKTERSHAGSAPISKSSRNQPIISQGYRVNIYTFCGIIEDPDLYLCNDWIPLC